MDHLGLMKQAKKKLEYSPGDSRVNVKRLIIFYFEILVYVYGLITT